MSSANESVSDRPEKLGLREKKSARSRQLMISVALDLFMKHGYENTTMEKIAEVAEVGTSTLYRYFPSKDLLILDRIIGMMNLGERLRKRPDNEALDIALGQVLVSVAREADDPAMRMNEIRQIVDKSTDLRVRFWDYALTIRSDLEAALAERMDRPMIDWSVRATAAIMLDILQMTDEICKERNYKNTSSQIVREIVDGLSPHQLVFPVIDRR